MKEAKKTQITEQICKQAQLMRKGGANQTEIGKLLGINGCTVSRIEAAGFDLQKYIENRKARREKEKANVYWADRLETAIKEAQSKVVKIEPRVFENLSDEDKLALINRAAAERTRQKPMSIYEVHLGSWKKDYRLNKDGFLNYRELADQLADSVEYLGFTHVEVMGICEYPFDGSWGYQVTGYFSPTSRHGKPEDLKYFIDKMHSRGIGVILDWVPAHFPKDAFGLVRYDGSPMFESEDPLLAEYPEWGTMAFDHARPEVRSLR